MQESQKWLHWKFRQAFQKCRSKKSIQIGLIQRPTKQLITESEKRQMKNPFSYSNSGKTIIIKKLWKSKNLSNHRVVMLKILFPMTTLWFDKIFDNRKKTEKPFVDHSVIWLDFQLFNSIIIRKDNHVVFLQNHLSTRFHSKIYF